MPDIVVVTGAIRHANRREVWAGFPTLVAMMANRIAPAFADYGARGKEARTSHFEMFTGEHRFWFFAAAAALLLGLHRAARRAGHLTDRPPN